MDDSCEMSYSDSSYPNSPELTTHQVTQQVAEMDLPDSSDSLSPTELFQDANSNSSRGSVDNQNNAKQSSVKEVDTIAEAADDHPTENLLNNISSNHGSRSSSVSPSSSRSSSPSPALAPANGSEHDIDQADIDQAALNASTLPSSGSARGFSQSVILNKIPRYAVLTVSQPQKVSDGSSSYISYLVTAQQFPGEKPERSRRRFSDFAKLYENLNAEFPACAIPPLPDRWRIEYIAGDRFSPEFTAKRAASLQRFLFRVSQHPFLRRSRSFMAFLSAQGMGKMPVPGTTSTSINGGIANSAPNSSGAGSAASIGTIGSVGSGSSDSAALSTALDHISEALMNAFTKAKNQSKEITDAKERAGRYEQNIATLDKAVVRASKTQSELAFDFENMHKQALKLAKLEPQSSHEFEKLAATAQSLGSATQQLRVGVDSHFACALRDMSHYVQALKGMLKQREQRQIDYEALVEYLKRSEHELVAAEHGQTAPAFSSSFLKSKMNELRGVDKEQARHQRITKLKARINVFKEESQRAKQISDDYEELAKREVRVFEQTEAIELQQSLSGLSDSYINFYQSVLKDFSELEASLD